MKRVLLIITFGLLSTTGHSAEAAQANQTSKATVRALENAGQRPNPFLEDRPEGFKRKRFERTQSDPTTPTSGALKKSKSHGDLTQLDDALLQQQAPTTNDEDDVFGPNTDLLWAGVPNGQRQIVSPEHEVPPLQVTSCLGELFTARKTVAAYNAGTRVIPAAALPLIAWVGSRTHWAQACFPELFPRSGTSTIIAWSLAGLAGAAGLWVCKDTIRAGMYTQEAFRQMELSQRELAAMANQIEQLRKGQLQVETQQLAMQQLLQETRTNATNARQGLEGLEESVKALVAQIKGDLGNAVHVKEVVALKERVTDLEAVLTQISLNQLNQADAQAPDLDVMARQAQDLAAAAQRFARTDDQQANQAFANAAAEKHRTEKNKKGWKFWQ